MFMTLLTHDAFFLGSIFFLLLLIQSLKLLKHWCLLLQLLELGCQQDLSFVDLFLEDTKQKIQEDKCNSDLYTRTS